MLKISLTTIQAANLCSSKTLAMMSANTSTEAIKWKGIWVQSQIPGTNTPTTPAGLSTSSLLRSSPNQASLFKRLFATLKEALSTAKVSDSSL